jgi:hypothetical protein
VASDLFRCAVLVEGLRLSESVQVGALAIEPVPIEGGFSGQELRQTFNDLLATHGFVSAFERWTWATQLATRRQLAFFTTPPVNVTDAVTASMSANEELASLVDALALVHGGAPRIFAAAHELSSDGGVSWRTLALMAGSGRHPTTAIERLIPDGDSLEPLDRRDIWVATKTSALVALWLSLHRGVSAEARWDVQILRACSLLEAIGRERLDAKTAIVDGSGEALLDNAGKPATTGQLRGKLYVLVNGTVGPVLSSPRVFLTDDARTLWEEVGIWTDIRNLVAHEGQWLPPVLPSSFKGAQERSAAALDRAGRGDGHEAGAERYSDAVLAATEAVLRSILTEEAAAGPRT